MKNIKLNTIIFLILLIAVILIGNILQTYPLISKYILFSDSAKYSDIARNIVIEKAYFSSFSNYISAFGEFGGSSDVSKWILPVMPYLIALIFRLFGVSDTSVIATSLFFFFLTVFFTFLLGKKLFGKTVSVLSALVVLVNQTFLDYAKTGASETLFMFEIVAIPYFMLFRKRWATAISFLLLFLSYFTRPQASIFIAGYILFYLLLKFKAKKALVFFIAVLIIGFLIDRLVLLPLNGKYFLYSITGRGVHAITQHSQYVAVSDVLRGVGEQPASIILTIKKTGTNLFNFYRSLPNIANPYLFAFFILSPLVLVKKKEERSFLAVSFFTAALSFLLPALTIPFYRYIHPVLPLVYVAGIGSMAEIIRITINNQQLTIKNNKFKKYLPALISSFLIFTFVLVMQVGTFIHDYKYYEDRRNYNKPPVYAVMSWKLKEITKPTDIILTNLDTWGSWYGERRTVWFPLKPDQIIDPKTGSSPFNAIYLTSYLMSDENYYMGPEWRQIFENPENIENEFIRNNYKFVGEYIFKADEVYEKYDSRAILLIKK